jgi:hypothetical protein
MQVLKFSKVGNGEHALSAVTIDSNFPPSASMYPTRLRRRHLLGAAQAMLASSLNVSKSGDCWRFLQSAVCMTVGVVAW